MTLDSPDSLALLALSTPTTSPLAGTPFLLSVRYRAPELLVGDADYGKGIDIWAIGCLLAELATGKPLFPGESDLRTLQCILSTAGGRLTTKQRNQMVSNPYFADMPDAVNGCCTSNESGKLEQTLFMLGVEVIQLLEKCLQIDPSLRPSCEQLLAEDYFAGNIEDFGCELKELIEKDLFESRMRAKQRLPSPINETPEDGLNSIAEEPNNSDEESSMKAENPLLKDSGKRINKVTITFPKSEHTGSGSDLNASFSKKSRKVPPGGGAILNTMFPKEPKNPLKAINSKRSFKDSDFQNPPLFLKEEHATKYNPKGDQKHGLPKLKDKSIGRNTNYPVASRLLALPQLTESKGSEKSYLVKS